ncbi:MAG: class I SAM-dependent methyltransferase [Anaerolineales bacterium]
MPFPHEKNNKSIMSIKSFVSCSQTQELLVNLNKELIRVITKPGFPEWNKITPATQLLAVYPIINPDDIILLLGCYQGALAVHLARGLREGNLFIWDHNHTALEMTQLSLEANKISSFTIVSEVELPRDLYQRFSKVFLQIPKGRQLSRRWLVNARNALEIGGSLYIAGANNEGIHSLIKDAHELFGNGRVLGYKKGNRIAQFSMSDKDFPVPEWAQAPGIAPGTWVAFPLLFPNRSYQIHSLPGVFSYNHLDAGTEMLLSAISISPGDKVLDVGCGYGIIGMVAASEGAALVHLVDNNLLAIASCNETIALNHINHTEVFAGDLLNPIGPCMYNLILSNPPFHAGFDVDYQIAHSMIKQSYEALLIGGKLMIVANRFIRYMNLIKDVFGNVSILKESEKFHVLSGLKSTEKFYSLKGKANE